MGSHIFTMSVYKRLSLELNIYFIKYICVCLAWSGRNKLLTPTEGTSFSSGPPIRDDGLIVGSLMLCWFPNQLRRLMTAAVPKSSWSLSYFWFYAWLHLVADGCFYLSSVLNPFLYNLSSRHFRQVFLQVLRCRLTVQHANRRAAPPPCAASARPLFQKSLRFGRRSGGGSGQQRAPPTFTTFQSDSAPSGCRLAVSLSEQTGPETGTETEI